MARPRGLEARNEALLRVPESLEVGQKPMLCFKVVKSQKVKFGESRVFQTARWRSADDAARAAYAADLDARLGGDGGIVHELETSGLRRWRGNVQAAARAIVAEIHAAEAAKIGLAGQARRFDADPPWRDATVADAEARFEAATSALCAAATSGDAAAISRATSDARRRRYEFDKAAVAARAVFFEWRLRPVRHCRRTRPREGRRGFTTCRRRHYIRHRDCPGLPALSPMLACA